MAFYPSDWLAGTARMTRMHRSVYFDICCYIWDHGKSVPLSEQRLMLGDLANWQDLVQDLVDSGKFERALDGSLTNERAIAEALKSFSLWERKSAGGKAGANATNSRNSGANTGGGSGDGTPAGSPAAEPEPEPEPDKPISKKGARSKKSHEVIDCPAGVDPANWQAFLDHRTNKRAWITAHAHNLILKALAESADTPNATIAKSVMNGWTGVFPTKGGHDGRSGKPSGWLA